MVFNGFLRLLIPPSPGSNPGAPASVKVLNSLLADATGGCGRSLREGFPGYDTKLMSRSAARTHDASLCLKSADSRSTATTITKMTINTSETSRY